MALLTEGHLLLEDVPGLGKTSLARALARSIDASASRIQFTPDLLPSDVTGVQVFNDATREFEFHRGPVFHNVVIGDEINRASPKTQSALLEVMEERQVTVDAETFPVERPFVVVATQNPVDLDGTYRLPEAQVDRFLLKVSVGYPDEDAELEIVAGQSVRPPLAELRPVLSLDEVRAMIALVRREVYVAPELVRYAIRLAAATRESDALRLGVSPRGTLALVHTARTRAAASGRDYVAPEDLKALAGPALAHRLVLTPEAELSGRSATEVLAEVLDQVPLPAVGAAVD
ncbi:MAG: AAA family ATPase [Acidimicrobiales bacterium]|nr:AAA family ATPase [Acidimicrobiales bacterium]MCB9372519.1 AAA family ATPase [Microthrixaceae bacterium]